MMSANPVSPNAPVATPFISTPCCIKVQECLCSRKTTQAAKVAFWWLAAFGMVGLGSAGFSIPFASGMGTGSALFMGSHELLQHPDSICWTSLNRPIAVSRNWKHILAGVVIAGTAWGMGSLAMERFPILAVVLCLGGFLVAVKIAYSDTLFVGDYRQLNPPTVIDHNEQNGGEEPSV